jgi:hypothetical protein
MSTTTGGDIINQADRTLALDEADQAHLDEFESMLDLIRDRTRSVAEGYQVGAYLVGRPGSSKTYTVKETLERLDAPWTYRNCRMSPMGLYCLLEEHPEHTVVLDDIHTLFGQDAALRRGDGSRAAPFRSTAASKNSTGPGDRRCGFAVCNPAKVQLRPTCPEPSRRSRPAGFPSQGLVADTSSRPHRPVGRRRQLISSRVKIRPLTPLGGGHVGHRLTIPTLAISLVLTPAGSALGEAGRPTDGNDPKGSCHGGWQP